jgi:hypothetical protein
MIHYYNREDATLPKGKFPIVLCVNGRHYCPTKITTKKAVAEYQNVFANKHLERALYWMEKNYIANPTSDLLTQIKSLRATICATQSLQDVAETQMAHDEIVDITEVQYTSEKLFGKDPKNLTTTHLDPFWLPSAPSATAGPSPGKKREVTSTVSKPDSDIEEEPTIFEDIEDIEVPEKLTIPPPPQQKEGKGPTTKQKDSATKSSSAPSGSGQTVKFHKRSKQEKKHKCTYTNCTFVGLKSNDLVDHIRVVHQNNPYKCPKPKCTKEYSNKRALQNHLKKHSGEKRLKCKYWGQTINGEEDYFQTDDYGEMAAHMWYKHSEGKELKCQHCNKKFNNLRTMKQHDCLKVKKFQCSKCGHTFYTAFGLKKHSQRHLKNPLYVCVYCGKTLSSKKTLKDHEARHGSDDEEAQK